MTGQVTCFECDGTGAYKSDCWLCEGAQMVTVKKAQAEGYHLDDLEDIEDDGYCRCPAYECNGDSCGLCEGSGKMEHWRAEHEVTRVLICAHSGHIPGRMHLLGNIRRIFNDELLSNFAGRICRDREWINWFTSVFGDEISLTPAGEAEYEARIFDWHKQKDVDNCALDIGGRWADDGGFVPEARA